MDIHLNRMRSSRLEDHEQEIKLATGKVKAIHISERGLTSTTWSEYSEKAVKRVQYSSSPTSSITAETVTVDGFALSQKAIERRGAKSLGALKPATIEFW